LKRLRPAGPGLTRRREAWRGERCSGSRRSLYLTDKHPSSLDPVVAKEVRGMPQGKPIKRETLLP
jgi:hypothetical protein